MKIKAKAKRRKNRKSEKNHELKKELGKKLFGYSAAAGAVLTIGAGAAEAVAIKTTPVTPVTIEKTQAGGGFFDLDIDGDSFNDVRFAFSGGYEYGYANVQGASNPGYGVNQFVASNVGSTSYFRPDRVDKRPINILVNSALQFGSGAGYAILGNSGDSTGEFTGERGFMGVRFAIPGDSLHFGWVDLELNSTASLLTIHAWGYETVAGLGILTGEGQEAQPVPEPATLVTLAMGAAGLYTWRRKRKRKAVNQVAEEESQNL